LVGGSTSTFKLILILITNEKLSMSTPAGPIVDAVSINRQCRFPIVLDSPHSGVSYPDDFDYAMPLQTLRRAEDTHVDKLFNFAHEAGYPMIAANFPRSYIDVNRSDQEIDPELFIGDWASNVELSAKAKLGKGLMWRILDDGTPIYTQRLAKTDYEHRVKTYWQPYHDAVSSTLNGVYSEHGFVMHVNCHSMPSVSEEYGTDFPGLVHPDIVLGDRDSSTNDPAITLFLQEQFTKLGYDCWVNKPYKGVELIRAYSAPEIQRFSMQLELNRKLYMDEYTLEPHDGFKVVQTNLKIVFMALEEFCRGRYKLA
jgi:N-formylglutamate deformylase